MFLENSSKNNPKRYDAIARRQGALLRHSGTCQWSCDHPTFFGKRVQRVLGCQCNKMFSLKVTPGGRVVGEACAVLSSVWKVQS